MERSFKVYEYPIEVIKSYIDTSIENGESAVYIATTDKPYAYISDNFTNYELLEENGLSGYTMHYSAADNGGTIIVGKDDLALFAACPFSEDYLSERIDNTIVSFLSEKYDNVKLDGNDILIDGKKVVGTAGNGFNGMMMHMFLASFEDHSVLIDKICPSRHGKIPSHIDRELVDRDDLKNKILECLK